jgi:hypothetical protein
MTSQQVLMVLPRLREDWQNHGQQNHLFGDMRSGQIEGFGRQCCLKAIPRRRG